MKLLVHGWLSSINSEWYNRTKDEYLQRNSTNIIAIDWSVHAGWLYSVARNSVEGVGDRVAFMVMDISQTFNISLNKFHLIGNSLGAHIVGRAGKIIM